MPFLESALSPDPRSPGAERRAAPRRAALLISAQPDAPITFPSHLVPAVAAALPAGWSVFGTRYEGRRALAETLRAVTQGGARDVVVVPMHPQFSVMTSGAIVRDLYGLLEREGRDLNVAVRAAWFDDEGYIKALTRNLMAYLSAQRLGTDGTHLRFVADDLARHDDAARDPYRNHVRCTAELVAGRLGWPAERWSVEYGRIPDEARDDDAMALVCSLPFPLERPGNATDQVPTCPSLWTFDPFIMALRNLVVHGPQPTHAGPGAPASPSVQPTTPARTIEEPTSLVMIGASLANGLGGGRGPAIRYSEARAFAEVKKSRKALRGFLDWMREHTPISEAFVWNTCQRIECYGWVPDRLVGAERTALIQRMRDELYGAEPDGLEVNVLTGGDAWHHLLRTASGLNSELPGDRDVADQLHTACRIGLCAKTVGPRSTTLVDRAIALAQDVRTHTAWGAFSTGYCSAALARICEVDESRPEELRHVVIGGSTTSRSVLAALVEAHEVPQRQLTLVYRDHHGQLKQLRSALGSGKRLRVHSYSEDAVLHAIAEADVVYFGIDQAEPVLDAQTLLGLRDFAAHPLTVVDFNSFGSVARLEQRNGVRMWSARELDQAVAAHAALAMTHSGFANAVEDAEAWIARHLPDVMPVPGHRDTRAHGAAAV
jgi:glutamyl-tRNA reductase